MVLTSAKDNEDLESVAAFADSDGNILSAQFYSIDPLPYAGTMYNLLRRLLGVSNLALVSKTRRLTVHGYWRLWPKY
uniref:Uncharacterized protein n=1 Tax=Amphimedon queenslandica TaxID=400682 RepID=A0A1X7T138_AMPQE